MSDRREIHALDPSAPAIPMSGSRYTVCGLVFPQEWFSKEGCWGCDTPPSWGRFSEPYRECPDCRAATRRSRNDYEHLLWW